MSANPRSHVEPSAYGRELAKNFGAADARSIVTRSLQHTAFAATEIRVDRPTGQLSEPIPPQDAYIICLVLRDLPDNSYWEEGREYGRYFFRAGETTIADLRRQPLGGIDKPIHSLLMYLPRTTMNALAEEDRHPRVENLRFAPGAGFRDETVRNLGLSLLPALRAPERANRLFTDHVALALAAHAMHAYGGQPCARRIRGGLAPWQEKRAKDMILGDLAGGTSLEAIAAACGLSVSHFARSFRQVTGLAPHAWLLKARVQRAMALLRRPDETLTEVALASGFADHSHFTKVFTRHTGVSPSVWRRLSIR
ncbi:helix-turn-helix transcriptional regulator [Phenylobacterium sp.]|uniref:helix-turn-helix transcriptional regulator n=1 Tax=Phenylobacterium sp. TaxID=1871053 RepID=UPI002BF7CDCB|nr:helix-turn-helix transcriptional regulator [Phenylobacterium sp.]HLZ77213.1 helix-turn-helix transcriptional regulator [Phenylobacterium sp.]